MNNYCIILKNIFNSILVYLYRKSNRIGAIGVNCKILALNDRTKREGRTAFLCIYDIMKAVYQKNGENKYE